MEINWRHVFYTLLLWLTILALAVVVYMDLPPQRAKREQERWESFQPKTLEEKEERARRRIERYKRYFLYPAKCQSGYIAVPIPQAGTICIGQVNSPGDNSYPYYIYPEGTSYGNKVEEGVDR